MSLARLVVPLYLRRAGHGDYLLYLCEAEANQWKPRAEVERLQLEKLERLLRHAKAEVPYYSEVLRDIDLSSMRSREDIQRIPVLSRAHLQQHGESLLAKGVDKSRLLQRSSSGSTGAPATVYLDHERSLRSWAYNTRHNRWAGYDWGSRVASLWGQPFRAPGSSPAANGWLGAKRTQLHDWMMGWPRELYLNPYGYTGAEMDRFARELARFRPDIVVGYCNSLGDLASHIREHRIAGIRPSGVVVGGETLTMDVRELLQAVFGAPVYLRYGTRELDIIASECERGNLHVNDDHILVELLPEPGEGACRLVATDLSNFAMPLIRYDLEDLATPGAEGCHCGRGLSLLGSIVGRTSEIFRSIDGRHVSGLWFSSQIRLIPGLTRYQVHQTSYHDFHIRLVAERKLVDEDLRGLVSGIRERFGPSARVNCEQVPEIKKVGSGKFRFLISDVR